MTDVLEKESTIQAERAQQRDKLVKHGPNRYRFTGMDWRKGLACQKTPMLSRSLCWHLSKLSSCPLCLFRCILISNSFWSIYRCSFSLSTIPAILCLLFQWSFLPVIQYASCSYPSFSLAFLFVFFLAYSFPTRVCVYIVVHSHKVQSQLSSVYLFFQWFNTLHVLIPVSPWFSLFVSFFEYSFPKTISAILCLSLLPVIQYSSCSYPSFSLVFLFVSFLEYSFPKRFWVSSCSFSQSTISAVLCLSFLSVILFPWSFYCVLILSSLYT